MGDKVELNSEHYEQVEFFKYCAVAYLFGFGQADSWYKNGKVPKKISDEIAIPELEWIHAIPNGGVRGDTKASAASVGNYMRAEGVKKGVSDIFLPSPIKYKDGRFLYCGLYIEMKAEKLRPVVSQNSTGETTDQKRFGEYVKAVGYVHAVCYNAAEAITVLKKYIALSDISKLTN